MNICFSYYSTPISFGWLHHIKFLMVYGTSFICLLLLQPGLFLPSYILSTSCIKKIFQFPDSLYLFIFFQSELLVPAHIPYSSHIYIYFIALHILQSGLLVPASIPWSSCCLSFLLYKHCEYPKISDTGVATFFLLNLYSLCMYNIYLYTCIYLRIEIHLYFLRTQLVCTNYLSGTPSSLITVVGPLLI